MCVCVCVCVCVCMCVCLCVHAPLCVCVCVCVCVPDGGQEVGASVMRGACLVPVGLCREDKKPGEVHTHKHTHTS